MANRRWLQLLGSLLIVELVATRTIVRHKTTTITNGDNVTNSWTTSHEDANEPVNPFGRDSEYTQHTQSTLHYSPTQTEIIRIGGSGIPTEDLVKQPNLIRGIDPEAITELLRTKQPVVRTDTDEAGQPRTKTLTLEPDGSIVCKTVTEAKPVASNPFPNSYWRTLSTPLFTPTQSEEPKTHFSSSRSGINFESSADKWPTFEDFMKTRTPTTTATVKTPVSWDPNNWPTFTSSIPKLPDLSHINSHMDESLKHPIDASVDTITPKTTTTTFSYEPMTWTRTYNWSSFSEPSDDFWKSPFESTIKTGTTTAATTTPTSTFSSSVGTKPTRTLDLADLPITGVLDSGKPFDDSFFTKHLLPEDTRNTFKIENIPESKVWPPAADTFNEPSSNIEKKKVKTFTQNVYSNTLPTSGDLDPKAREILEKAGINPEDIKTVGETITKTREEPDGRVITTTYKVRTVPSFNMDDTSAPKKTVAPSFAEPSYSPGWRYPSFENFPTRAVGFESNGSVSPALGNKNPIEDYLSKMNLSPADILAQNGEVRRTIVDDDGRVLTATFVLSAPIPNNGGTKKQAQRKPIK